MEATWIMFLLYIALGLSACAHSIPLPGVSEASSENGAYSLSVTPAIMPDRMSYFYLSEGHYSLLFSRPNPPSRESLIPWLALYANEQPNRRLLWERPAATAIAPMISLVTDNGYILLLGSWPGTINSRMHAFTLYDPSGSILVTRSLGEIFTPEEITKLVTFLGAEGSWWGEIALHKINIPPNGSAPFPNNGSALSIMINITGNEKNNPPSPHRITIRASGEKAGTYTLE
jgi:hypothetical protein